MRDVDSIRTGTLAAVHQGLSIDEAWTHWDDDAFGWWPGGGVRQRLIIEKPRPEDGAGAWRLVVETSVWHAKRRSARPPSPGGAMHRIR